MTATAQSAARSYSSAQGDDGTGRQCDCLDRAGSITACQPGRSRAVFAARELPARGTGGGCGCSGWFASARGGCKAARGNDDHQNKRSLHGAHAIKTASRATEVFQERRRKRRQSRSRNGVDTDQLMIVCTTWCAVVWILLGFDRHGAAG